MNNCGAGRSCQTINASSSLISSSHFSPSNTIYIIEHLLQRYGRLLPQIHRYYYPFLASVHAASTLKSLPKLYHFFTKSKITITRQSDNKIGKSAYSIPSRSLTLLLPPGEFIVAQVSYLGFVKITCENGCKNKYNKAESI